MMIYQFRDSDAALEFYRRVEATNADTPAKREAILMELAREGLMERVVHTNRTKDQVVKDLAKHYRVLHVKAKEIGDENAGC